MIETKSEVREPTIEVSPRALALICPEQTLPASRRSLFARLRVRLRVRARLVSEKFRFRLQDLQPLRCRVIQARMRMRLFFLRFRHGTRLK